MINNQGSLNTNATEENVVRQTCKNALPADTTMKRNKANKCKVILLRKNDAVY